MIKILYGDIVFTSTPSKFDVFENSYLVSKDGIILGIFKKLPGEYKNFEIDNYENKLIIPGLIDLHLHAPQYAYRGLGMDLELIDWLQTNIFPEEVKYKNVEYAAKAYDIFVDDLKHSFTTRCSIFATTHKDSTILLMDKLEQSGLITFVGKVNMDRNCPPYIKEETNQSYLDTINFLETIKNKAYKNTKPILTPRFIPSCTDELLDKIKEIQIKYNLPVQSHLSENLDEIEWVKNLCKNAKTYAEAYSIHGLFGNDVKTLMAHCIYLDDNELNLIKKNNVYIVHCPESNTNLKSGIAPIKKYLENGLNVALGTDISAGSNLNMFYAMVNAIQQSKLRWKFVDKNYKPITEEEAFYLATKGGGSFFGKVGSFENGYNLDALVIDDDKLKHPQKLSISERIKRTIYLADERVLIAKYIKGKKINL